MAATRGSSIERTTEYNEFISRVAEFYRRRGTNFDPEPRVGNRHVDLRRLFEVVVERGGYDAVSAEKMAWRHLGVEFGLGQAGTAPGSMAFNLKTAYYKNLAAFEIATVHGKEPPPREILEDISARGGNILERTLENFEPHGARDQGRLGGSDSLDGTMDSQPTAPTEGSMVGGRSTRAVNNRFLASWASWRLTHLIPLGLRQAPLQRVLFHNAPPSGPPRPTIATPSSSRPTPMEERIAVSNDVFFGERPEHTQHPSSHHGNPPAEPAATRSTIPARLGDQEASDYELVHDGVLYPGTGHQGPNIFIRAIMGFRSGIPVEVAYGLHHILRMSFDMGHKLTFVQFPSLCRPLLEKYAQIGEVLYGHDWSVCFDRRFSEDALAALIEASNYARPMGRLRVTKDEEDDPALRMDSTTNRRDDVVVQIAEASLILRNMSIQPENAAYLAYQSATQHLLMLMLSMHDGPLIINELKQETLEMVEELSPFWNLEPDHPLLSILQQFINSEDRGRVVPALRALGRMSLEHEDRSELPRIEAKTLHRVLNLLLLPHDEELILAGLVFLQRYTTSVANIETLIEEDVLTQLIEHLTRMLLHGAREISIPYRHRTTSPPQEEQPEGDQPQEQQLQGQQPKEQQPQEQQEQEANRLATTIAARPIIEPPDDIFDQIREIPEPQRSVQWIRTCFEKARDGEISQVTLFNTYVKQFLTHFGPNESIEAADFMAVFPNAIRGARAHQMDEGTFVVAGIRARTRPVDMEGTVYMRCEWQTSDEDECGAFRATSAEMCTHVWHVHLQAIQLIDGKASWKERPDQRHFCRWGGCKKFDPEGSSNAVTVAGHAKLHFAQPKKPDPDVEALPESTICISRSDTAKNEHNQAVGVPLQAVCVLRNLAMLLTRMDPTPKGVDGLMGRYFLPSGDRIYHAWAVNMVLRKDMADLVELVKKASWRINPEISERILALKEECKEWRLLISNTRVELQGEEDIASIDGGS